MSERWAKLIALVGSLVFVIAMTGASPAAAAGNGTVKGTVVNGTKNVPVSGIEVTLHVFQGDVEATTRTATTGADGSFSFGGLDTGGTWGYAVSGKYENVVYQPDKAALAAGETKSVELKVYETTDSPANVKLQGWRIWIDREGKGAAIQYDLQVVNSGNTTYVGKPATGGSFNVVTSLPVPAGAGNIQYLGFFLQGTGALQGSTFLHSAPIVPGTSQGTLRVSVASLTSLSLAPPFAVDTLTLIVPSGMKLTAPGLQSGGTTTDNGVSYQVFGTNNVPAGQTLAVTMSGVTSKKVPTTTVALLVVIGVLVVGAAVVWVRRGRGGQRSTPSPKARPKAAPVARRQPRPVARAGVPSGAVSGVTNDEQADGEAELLIDELAALDLAFERGLVPEESYRRVRTARKARLVELRELDGDRAEAE